MDTIKSFVINLDLRVDRWYIVKEELRKQGIHAKRFSAIEGKPGWKGCRDSHLVVMELCKNEDCFLIFEDDVIFLEDINHP